VTPGGPATARPPEPTIRDVAQAAGVSKSTVSNVIRGADGVAESTRERVLAAAARVGYRPNALARNLVRRRTTTVGIVVGDLSNPIFSELAKLAEQRLSRAGLATMICNTDGHPGREQEKLEMLLEHRVAGILMLQFSGERSTLERLRAAGTSVVLLTQAESEADCVVVDERRGAELAVSHLLELGHRHIAYLSSELVELATDSARFAGYASALDAAGIPRDPRLVVRLGHPAYLRSDEGVRAAIGSLLAGAEPATAIFASNDLLAVDVLETVEEMGLAVPRDVSVVGFDDIQVAGLARISLTTVAQPCEDLARIGIELLLEAIDGERAPSPPRQRLLEPALVVRGSTAPPLLRERHVADVLPGA
jgi:DNA-binding LacI/PurR family transcriptional regulator